MSQENVEIVRRGYERWEELGRFDFEFFDPEIEWRGPREFPDLAEPHFGHEGVARYFAKVSEAFDDYRMSPEEFIDAGGDQVLVFSAREGAARAAGPRSRPTPLPTSGRSATARLSACRVTGSARTPSKAPGCRSRRCRRRTWSLFTACLRLSTDRTLMRPSLLWTPTSGSSRASWK